MSQQYLRKCSLIVFGTPPTPGGSGLPVPATPAAAATGTQVTINAAQYAQDSSLPGLDLSQFRIQFQVNAMDVDTPPTAIIRVFNLAKATVSTIQKEFQGVTLQAGYEDGNFGVIFQGSIVRTRTGRLSNIDSFLDIMASNFDAIYNFGFVNKTLSAGSNLQAKISALQQSVNSSTAAQAGSSAFGSGVQTGYIPDSIGTGGILPRGQVLFGLWREHMTNAADSAGCTWSVGPDGKINVIPLTGYLPGEAVVINAASGMVGVPEATPQGILVKCLLNPLIKCGTRLQIDNAAITQTQNNSAVGFPAYQDYQFFASTSRDGFYRAIVVGHEGDTRGHGGDWLTKITALNIDQSAPAGSSVAAYG